MNEKLTKLYESFSNPEWLQQAAERLFALASQEQSTAFELNNLGREFARLTSATTTQYASNFDVACTALNQALQISQEPLVQPEVVSIEQPKMFEGTGGIASLEDVYAPGKTQIWFAKGPWHRTFRNGVYWLRQHDSMPNIAELEETHTLVGTLAEKNLRNVLAMMQAEAWSRRGEARDFIRNLGLTHVGMSVGDIIVTPERSVMVDRNGFYDLGLREMHEEMDFSAIIEGLLEFDLMAEGPESMALSIGTTVYCGSMKGKVAGPVEGHPDKVLVDLENGDQDVFPIRSLTLKNPGFMRRAASWMVGEDEELEEVRAPIRMRMNTYPVWNNYCLKAGFNVDGDEDDATAYYRNGKVAGEWWGKEGITGRGLGVIYNSPVNEDEDEEE